MQMMMQVLELQEKCLVSTVDYVTTTVLHVKPVSTENFADVMSCDKVFDTRFRGFDSPMSMSGAVLGKNTWGWPLIVWEATTSRTTVSNCPVLKQLRPMYRNYPENWGGAVQDLGVPPLAPT